MFKSITQRLPLRVALPLLLSSIVLACVIALVLLLQYRADRAVTALALQHLAQVHGRITDRISEPGVIDDGDLDQFLAAHVPGTGGVVYLADQRGLLVASSVREPVKDPVLGTAHMAREANDPLIRATASHLARLGPSGSGGVQGKFPGADGALLMAATPLADSDPPRRILVTVIPASAYLADLQADRWQTALFAVGIVLFALLLGTLLARYVSRPITELTDHMRRIGQGRLDEEIFLTEFPEFMRLSFATNNMVEGLRENLKLRTSLSMAMEVQQRLLPAEVPRFPGLDMAGRSYYCDETGGDYYDFLKINAFPGSCAVIAIGDVSGHGIASAMVMAAARVILRSRCKDAASLPELLGHMNAQIVEDSGGGRYMTMMLVAVDAASGELRWSSAGHREPLLLEPGAAELRQLHGADIPLGITADAGYQEHLCRDLRPGQLILLATDGLWEAANNAGEPFGLARLGAVMREHASQGAQGICAAIALNVLEFCGNMTQRDDISFVVVKVV